MSDRKNKEKVYTKRINNNTLTNFISKGYRLPTEAEWEYAAKGGNNSKGFTYSGDSVLTNVAWFYENSKNYAHSVKTLKANELGLFDMSGNVWEWCNDWYAPYYSTQKENPRGPENGKYHIVRGGSWISMSTECQLTDREESPFYRSHFNGFRCVRYD
jgi:formylglycine-generating enzyme